MNFRRHAACLASGLLLATGAQAALVLNGDFEAPVALNGSGFALVAPADWTFAGVNPVIFGADYNSVVDPFGAQAFQLERTNDTLSQTITGLTPTTAYVLSFQLSTFGTTGNPSLMNVGLSNSDALLTAFNTSALAWTGQAIVFTPTSSSITLSFTNVGTTNVSYPQLDNIAISPVPESGQWAMLLSGLGLVSLVAKRSNKP